MATAVVGGGFNMHVYLCIVSPELNQKSVPFACSLSCVLLQLVFLVECNFVDLTGLIHVS